MNSEIVNKEYALGYCMAALDHAKVTTYDWLDKADAQCEELVLGIPDEWVMARIFGDSRVYNAQETRKTLLDSGKFSDVIILDAEHLAYQKVYEKIKFDVCFYGTEYGIPFDVDRAFMQKQNISFVPLFSEGMQCIAGGGSLRIALEDVQRRQKIVLFGTGVYFDAYMKNYAVRGEKYSPTYAIDNDSSKWGTEKDGVKIYEPAALRKETAADVLVVVCSKQYKDMLHQLRQLGRFNYRTLLFLNDIALLEEFAITFAEERDYLRNSHRILTVLMKEFDRVCQENHIHYYIICGSLIGVIRHKGMIPWDDDIDLAMPRKDFKKLRRIAKRVWPKGNDTFVYRDYDDIGGGAFLDCMPRLFYMKEKLPTKCFDKVYGKASKEIEDRMFLDIYIMDNAHKNEKVHNLVITIMKGIYNLMMGHRAFIDYDEYRTVIPEKTIKAMKVVHGIGKRLPLRFLSFWYDTLSRSGNWNKNAKDYIMPSCAIRCIELKYPKEHFGEGQRLPFEDIEVMVPSDYNKQLNAMRYRNYMEFPRMSVRKPSHYFNSDIEIW